MNNNTHGTLRVLPATLFMLAVLLASPASSAGVHDAEVEGTRSQSSMIALASCDGKRASHTHGEPSTKLITALKAHHCDGHAPSHRPGIIIDSHKAA